MAGLTDPAFHGGIEDGFLPDIAAGAGKCRGGSVCSRRVRPVLVLKERLCLFLLRFPANFHRKNGEGGKVMRGIADRRKGSRWKAGPVI